LTFKGRKEKERKREEKREERWKAGMEEGGREGGREEGRKGGRKLKKMIKKKKLHCISLLFCRRKGATLGLWPLFALEDPEWLRHEVNWERAPPPPSAI
jgi:hypothetical protein